MLRGELEVGKKDSWFLGGFSPGCVRRTWGGAAPLGAVLGAVPPVGERFHAREALVLERLFEVVDQT